MIEVRRSISLVILSRSWWASGEVDGDLVGEQLDVEGDARQRVADLVGDLGGELADGGEAFAEDEPALAFLQGGGHLVELAGELADLVAAGRAVDDDMLGPVAAAELADAEREAPQRSHGPDHAERGDESEQGDHQGQQDDHAFGVAFGIAHLVAELDNVAADLVVEAAKRVVDGVLAAGVAEHVGGGHGGRSA